MPALQGPHVELPLTSEYVPAPHVVQLVEADVLAYFPTSHAMHPPAPVTDAGQENIILRQLESYRPVLHPTLQPPPPFRCQLSLDEQSSELVSALNKEMELVDANPTLLPGWKYQKTPFRGPYASDVLYERTRSLARM